MRDELKARALLRAPRCNEIRGARAPRTLVLASRQNELLRGVQSEHTLTNFNEPTAGGRPASHRPRQAGGLCPRKKILPRTCSNE